MGCVKINKWGRRRWWCGHVSWQAPRLGFEEQYGSNTKHSLFLSLCSLFLHSLFLSLFPYNSEVRETPAPAQGFDSISAKPQPIPFILLIPLKKLSFWWGGCDPLPLGGRDWQRYVRGFHAQVLQGLLESPWSWYPARQYSVSPSFPLFCFWIFINECIGDHCSYKVGNCLLTVVVLPFLTCFFFFWENSNPFSLGGNGWWFLSELILLGMMILAHEFLFMCLFAFPSGHCSSLNFSFINRVHLIYLPIMVKVIFNVDYPLSIFHLTCLWFGKVSVFASLSVCVCVFVWNCQIVDVYLCFCHSMIRRYLVFFTVICLQWNVFREESLSPKFWLWGVCPLSVVTLWRGCPFFLLSNHS